ncbi:HAD family hydrolase [Arenimonas sp.]|uniref:HAD family hydrolase n=1 Tax=Arenimonas sp. TaxID=1872635 RepID=UPI0025C29FEB|nr:HAD family hydrolase [Arenimonas sp.]
MPDLALFDFDGTLTRGETFPPFVRSVVPAERLRWGRWRLAPLVAGYRLGLVSGTRIREAVVARGLTGMAASRFESAAAEWARDRLPALLRPAALARLRAHRDRGDTVRIVSGNFECLLSPWAATEGVVAYGSRLEARDGRLTGRYAGPQCVLEHKVWRIRAELDLTRFDRIHAYGDTPEDRPMLLLADVAHYLPRGWPEGMALPSIG